MPKDENIEEVVEAAEIIEKGTVQVKTIKQIAVLVGACGVIIGAILTVDGRYAKPADIAKATLTLQESIDELHKDILENEQLRLQLGNDVKSTRILLDKNKQELAEVKQRLLGQRMELNQRSIAYERAAESRATEYKSRNEEARGNSVNTEYGFTYAPALAPVAAMPPRVEERIIYMPPSNVSSGNTGTTTDTFVPLPPPPPLDAVPAKEAEKPTPAIKPAF